MNQYLKPESKLTIIIRKIKEWAIKVYKFCTTPPNPKESILQWTFRQLLIPDSSGNPSATHTLATVVIALSVIVVMNEISIATSYIETYNEAGKVVSKRMVGFSAEFWFFMLTLAGAATYLFRQRQKSNGISAQDSKEDDEVPGVNAVNTLVDTVTTAITKIKSK
jgi:hypothetical protein